MYAAKNNFHKALKPLIALNSSSINQEDNNQKTILMYVMSAQVFDRKLANELIEECQADVNHVDMFGRSILIKLVIERKKRLVEFLLSKGALKHLIDSE